MSRIEDSLGAADSYFCKRFEEIGQYSTCSIDGIISWRAGGGGGGGHPWCSDLECPALK